MTQNHSQRQPAHSYQLNLFSSSLFFFSFSPLFVFFFIFFIIFLFFFFSFVSPFSKLTWISSSIILSISSSINPSYYSYHPFPTPLTYSIGLGKTSNALNFFSWKKKPRNIRVKNKHLIFNSVRWTHPSFFPFSKLNVNRTCSHTMSLCRVSSKFIKCVVVVSMLKNIWYIDVVLSNSLLLK